MPNRHYSVQLPDSLEESLEELVELEGLAISELSVAGAPWSATGVAGGEGTTAACAEDSAGDTGGARRRGARWPEESASDRRRGARCPEEPASARRR